MIDQDALHIFAQVKVKLSDKIRDLAVSQKVRFRLLYPSLWNNEASLTLYDPGGGGLKAPPFRFFALTHLILELHYCALGTFPKKIV